MSDDDRVSAGKGTEPEDKPGGARRSRTIRFSDIEWETIENAAEKRGIAAAEYIRFAALDAAEGRVAAIDAEIVETIRRIYRHTYIVSTLARDEMVREGRDAEMESAVNAARESQALLRKETSE